MIAVAGASAPARPRYRLVSKHLLGSVHVPLEAQQVVPVAQSTVLSTHWPFTHLLVVQDEGRPITAAVMTCVLQSTSALQVWTQPCVALHV